MFAALCIKGYEYEYEYEYEYVCVWMNAWRSTYLPLKPLARLPHSTIFLFDKLRVNDA